MPCSERKWDPLLEPVIPSLHRHRQVLEAMEAEHVNRFDSNREFTPSNYEITTTSAIEWKFSASPENPPAGGFPKEQKILRAQVRGCACPGSRVHASLIIPRHTTRSASEHVRLHVREPISPPFSLIDAIFELACTGLLACTELLRLWNEFISLPAGIPAFRGLAGLMRLP